jgi:nicotinamidase-related amidase
MPHSAGSWDSFALVLVDVQRDFWREEMSVPLAHYEKKVSELLACCRHERIDVVHLSAGFKPDRSDWMVRYLFEDRIPCIEGTPGAETFGFAAPRADEKRFRKQSFDGFLVPDFSRHLHSNGKRFLFIAGLVTSVCVLFTAASAAQRGYLVTLVEDCCADSPEAHAQTLERYPFVFERTTAGQIVPRKDEYIERIGRLPAG